MTTPENDRQDSQANKPLELWEQPGSFRRDCEPHRGNLLMWTALASALAACLSLAAVGLALGLATLCLSRRDLDRMRKGLMDPAGERLTRQARRYGTVGCLLACLLLPLQGFAIVGMWQAQRRRGITGGGYRSLKPR